MKLVYIYIYIYIYIRTPPDVGKSTLSKELSVATRLMQIPSYELRTSGSDSTECKQTKVNTYALIPELTFRHRLSLGLRYHPDEKLGGFDPCLERLACVAMLK